MTKSEWLAVTLASAPPLTAAQVSALRPVFAPHINAAPAVMAGAAPARTATDPGRDRNDES